MINERGIGIFGFAVLANFLDRFSVFVLKNFGFPGFGVPCGLQIFRFLASDFLFSRKILTGFRI